MTREQSFFAVLCIGTWLGGNPATGGALPEGTNSVFEFFKIFYGDFTPHNCYGSAPVGCAGYW
ncbi:MAG: hypothetical protein LBM17_06625 [Candidatus Accumulibacter sp.]|nr:hypothetical protein [Accumulibacter sp.]